MRYVGLAFMAVLIAALGYIYMDRARVQQALVAEIASHQSTKDNYKAEQVLAQLAEQNRLVLAAQELAQNNERKLITNPSCLASRSLSAAVPTYPKRRRPCQCGRKCRGALGRRCPRWSSECAR
jgi:hypothetical protein